VANKAHKENVVLGLTTPRPCTDFWDW